MGWKQEERKQGKKERGGINRRRQGKERKQGKEEQKLIQNKYKSALMNE